MLKRVRNRILRAIYQNPVFQVPSELAYKAALEKYIGNLPVLSPTDYTLVDALRHEGVVITCLEALAMPSTPLLLDAAQRLLPKLTPDFCNNKKYFLHATSDQIMEHADVFFWGLEERLLNIAENYIGLPVAYHGLCFRRDLVNELKIKTRHWHLDVEDRRIFRVIVYLNDVYDNDGPFQYIPKHLTQLLSTSLKYNYGYVPDKAVETVIPRSDWKSCIGPSGTVIFADTGSIFHRGKIPVESDRISVFFNYTSRQPKYPYYCKSSLSRKELIVLLNRLPKRQKEYVFGKNKLI